MTTLVPAAIKKEELAKLDREKEAYDALSYSAKKEWRKEKWLEQAKTLMVREIEYATFFPHRITSGPLMEFSIGGLKGGLKPWLKEAGYSLHLKWHDAGSCDHVDEIVISFAE